MKALASFIMKGPLQAILLVVVSGALSLVLPPLSVLTGGIVALVTLRNGAKAGISVLVGASLILGLFAYFAMPGQGTALIFLLSLLVTVFPVWLLAIVLRSSISLTKTINLAVIMGGLMVCLVHLLLPDPALWWEELLHTAIGPALQEAQFATQGVDVDANIKAMSVWMTGLVAAAMTLSYMASLLIGRWMQAMLYNPGGFKQEFLGLRLSREMAITTLVVLLVAFLLDGSVAAIAKDLMWVLGAIYIVPGLSVVHQWIDTMNSSTIWLVVLYLLLLFVPQIAVLMAVIGWGDTWVNFRARLSREEK